jgi:hypothetical protein
MDKVQKIDCSNTAPSSKTFRDESFGHPIACENILKSSLL